MENIIEFNVIPIPTSQIGIFSSVLWNNNTTTPVYVLRCYAYVPLSFPGIITFKYSKNDGPMNPIGQSPYTKGETLLLHSNQIFNEDAPTGNSTFYTMELLIDGDSKGKTKMRLEDAEVDILTMSMKTP